MVDSEDAHIGAAASAALLDDFGCGVEHVHEGDGAGGNAFGGPDDIAPGSEATERETGPSTGLMDDGHFPDCAEDAGHGILDGDDEASGELASRQAGVHKRRRVGEEFKPRHHLEEPFFPAGGFRWGNMVQLGFGDGRGHATEHAPRGFGCAALLVPSKVSPLEHANGVNGEFQFILDAEEALGLPKFRAMLTIEDEGLCDLVKTFLNEDFLDAVLNLFDGGVFPRKVPPNDCRDFEGESLRQVAVGVAGSDKGPRDRRLNPFPVIRREGSVSLANFAEAVPSGHTLLLPQAGFASEPRCAGRDCRYRRGALILRSHERGLV